MEQVLDSYRERGCKFFVGIDVELSQMLEDRSDIANFATRASTLLTADDAMVALYEHFQTLVGKVDTFLRDGSGWISHDVKRVLLYVTRLVSSWLNLCLSVHKLMSLHPSALKTFRHNDKIKLNRSFVSSIDLAYNLID